MARELRETRLPGVGVKYTALTAHGGRLTVILHNEGQREIYWFRRTDDEEPTAVIQLEDDEARQLGAIIGGAYERPKIVEELEMAFGELAIEWVAVPDTSPAIGKTLAEAAFRQRCGHHGHRHPAGARAGRGRAARRRDRTGRHARHRRQAGPVPGLPQAPRRGAVLAHAD